MLAALALAVVWIRAGLAQEVDSAVSITQCSDGYRLDRLSGQCRDINECRTIRDACKGDMRCINHNGGYLCLPRTASLLVPNGPSNPTYPVSSQSGYSEMASPSVYQPASIPRYPIPSRSLICRFGYTVDSNNNCADVDECTAGTHQCNPSQICINTEGGYSCSCTDGYWLTDGQCMDIDECRHGYCQQLCANIAGSYSCQCNSGFLLNADGRSCQDVDECSGENPCGQQCINTYGSFLCRCDTGYELNSEGMGCSDINECSFSEFLCQHQCVNEPGDYYCICPEGYTMYSDNRSCQDIDECEMGNNTCTEEQICINIPGTYKCLDPVQCQDPYIQLNENRCMCHADNPGCSDQPFTILYKYMDIVSSRSVPSDIFQMQATARYPGAYYIFQIKSGNEGREFYMRQTGPVSATVVMTRPIQGPRDVVLDLEMVTVNTVINFRGGSVIRLSIYISEYTF
ncbi:fibulin-5 isoform X1 [Amblyraja radiata]|uniref:fibulin-5 isoform X1 n=1 Tax=Amblyraja radiata TaxID=386614 RepID=UPI0014041B16|nr:fibulin-5 isoform X1 [Amblyraja radiata]